MKWIKDIEHILYTRFFVHIEKRIKKVRLGSDQISLYLLISLFIRKVQQNEISDRASAVAYNIVLAVFPFIIFLFTLIPYIPVGDFYDNMFRELHNILPDQLYTPIEETIRDIAEKPRGGLLSLGFFSALYTATNGMAALMSAFNKSSHFQENRGFIMQRTVAVLLTLLLSSLIVVSIFTLVSGEVIMHLLLQFKVLQHDFFFHFIDWLRYLITISVFLLAISFIYYWAPSIHMKFKHILMGAVVATVCIVLISVCFSMYLINFNTYNKLYGSIGTFIAFMVWIYAISFAILLGYEWNISLIEARRVAVLSNENKILPADDLPAS